MRYLTNTDKQLDTRIDSQTAMNFKPWWKRNGRSLRQIILAVEEKVENLMATLADVQAAVAAESTVADSVITLLGQIHDQLTAALAANDPAALQAVVDSINAEKQKLADAVTANTPAAPTTP